jgi:hypothetical protein
MNVFRQRNLGARTVKHMTLTERHGICVKFYSSNFTIVRAITWQEPDAAALDDRTPPWSSQFIAYARKT